MIFTDRGLIPARDLAEDGEEVNVLIDGRFDAGTIRQASRVFSTGVKPVYRVTTREGYTVRVTGDHRIKTDRGWVAANNLTSGDRLHIANQGSAFGDAGSYDLGLVLGWLVGDGHITDDRAVLSFYGEKQQLTPQFEAAVNRIVRPAVNGREYHVGTATIGASEQRIRSERLREIADEHGLKENKLQVPRSVLCGSRGMQNGFLRALFEADGTVLDAPNGTRGVRLTSVSLSLLTDVQRLLLNFGIYSRIYQDRKHGQGERLLPDGKGGMRPYPTQPWHDLSISRGSILRFAEKVGFLSAQRTARLDQIVAAYSRGPYAETFIAHVAGVTPDGTEEVYDLTEPVTHSFVADGIVVHNCGEQPLPPWGICNLGALNLASFVQGREVDLEALTEMAKVAVRFQDNVIDASYYPLPENKEWAKKERRVGLGVMGLADMLIKMGLRYGSDKSLQVADDVFRTIRDAAYTASCDLAEEKGAFPAFDVEGYMQSAFVQRLPEAIKERIRRHGIRNITLLTVAPTGTTSLLAGASSGIEPVFRFRTLRKDALGEHVILHPLAEAWQAEHPDEALPDYFVSAEQLSPEQHVKMQAIAQRHIDASISKTVNAPNSHKVEDVERLFTFAYEQGCKGCTYFRAGSTQQVVLQEARPETKPADEFVELLPRPQRMLGRAYTVKTHFGSTMTLDIHEVEPGIPFEVFVNVGAAGSDLTADAIAMGRLASAMLRMDSRISPARRLDIIIDKLKDIGSSHSNGFGAQRVSSLASAIAKALEMYLNEIRDDQDVPAEPQEHGQDADLCPECGSYTLVREEGCAKCQCGYSAC